MDLKTQHDELFSHRMIFFLFLAEKNPEFTKRNFGCESGIFFLPNKKMSYSGEKSGGTVVCIYFLIVCIYV